jgi:Transposase IS66 family
MQSRKVELPPISEAELSIPIVPKLLAFIQAQAEEIARLREEVQTLKDEVARLKNQKGKPDIKPSNLDKKNPDDDKKPGGGKRPGSDKESKKDIPIHEIIRLKPAHLPPGAIFKGVREFDVQDIRITPHNTRYQIEEWADEDGKTISVDIPNVTAFPHFGGDVVSFILYQYHQCHVTHPLLLEQLEEFGVRISAGQLSRILTDEALLKKFHDEKKSMFQAGITSTGYVQADDTGARHDGKNGYATFVGNEFFSWFESSPSKSRINFLHVLQGGKDEAIFLVNQDAFDYMREEKLPKASLEILRFVEGKVFASREAWDLLLQKCGIKNSRHIRIATEAALFAGALSKGLSRDFIVLSDDAGQFNIPLLQHGLCWVHAERLLATIIAVHPQGQVDLEKVLADFWQLYRTLKNYRKNRDAALRKQIETIFDELFLRTTACQTLNLALKRLHENREELLLVLDYPDLPLHNNMSESDIREYVKRRKISGGTRSVEGQKARDTFTSLKKTCRKLGVSFWSYLKDRISGRGHIAQLAEIIRKAAENRNPSHSLAAA